MGRRTVVLVVALLLASISAFAIWNFLTSAEDEAREGLVEQTVFRATELLERGELGSDVLDRFEESTENEDFLPENHIGSAEELARILSGRILLGPISRGQIVTTDLWGDPEDVVSGLSEVIEPGMVAISIRPDEVRGVGGFIRSGDNIGVIASGEIDLSVIIEGLRSPGGRAVFFPTLQEDLELDDDQIVELADALPPKVQFSQIALQNVKVLAVGDEARDVEALQPDEGDEVTVVGGQVLTLEVTPEQAERVAFIQEFLTQWIVLEPIDFDPVVTDGAELEDIIDLPQQFLDELEGLGVLDNTGS